MTSLREFTGCELDRDEKYRKRRTNQEGKAECKQQEKQKETK
jgi:hypothetical protein